MEKFEQKKNQTTNNGGMTMIKNMKKQLKNEKGLTLIELLAVIVILAIIAAIAIPAIGNIIANSKYNAIKSDGINVINAAQLYYLDYPDEYDGDNSITPEVEGAVTAKGLQDTGYLDNKGTIPNGATISRDTPNKLTATGIEFNGKSVEFNNVSIEDINADSQKGSESGEKAINPQED